MKMYPHTFSGEPAVQVASELESLLALVRSKNVKSYLEIGVGRGDTFHEIVSAMPEGSYAMALDMPEQQWGLNGSKKQLEAACADLRMNYRDARAIFGDSKALGTIQHATINGPYDLVFIDGDHTYDGVKSDWDNYGKLGKIVAFHDIADTQRPNSIGEVIKVPTFWNELKKHYRHEEYIAPGSTMGIGVIFRD